MQHITSNSETTAGTDKAVWKNADPGGKIN